MQNKDVQSEARLPALPVGNSDWAAVKSGYWSADKTQLISGLLDKKSTVAIFTRPRRFGKTFTMNMLQAFFEKTEKSNAYLFKGAKGETWEETLRGICAAVRVEYKRHRPVFEASDCDEDVLLAASAKQAHGQIDERRHAAGLEAAGVAAVLKYGIGFSGKRVALAK